MGKMVTKTADQGSVRIWPCFFLKEIIVSALSPPLPYYSVGEVDSCFVLTILSKTEST